MSWPAFSEDYMSAIATFIDEYREKNEKTYFLLRALAHVDIRAEEGSEKAAELGREIRNFLKRNHENQVGGNA